MSDADDLGLGPHDIIELHRKGYKTARMIGDMLGLPPAWLSGNFIAAQLNIAPDVVLPGARGAYWHGERAAEIREALVSFVRSRKTEAKEDAQDEIGNVHELLPGFKPITDLWGESAPFRSEHQARWFLRQQRENLDEAGALAIFRGRHYFHSERLKSVVQRVSIRASRERTQKPRARGIT